MIDFFDVICQVTNQSNLVTCKQFERKGSEIGIRVAFTLSSILLVNIKIINWN